MMRIAILTSNAVRHKFLANTLATHADEALVISECKENDLKDIEKAASPAIAEHFRSRYQTEMDFFPGNNILRVPSVPLLRNEIRLESVYNTLRAFAPDAMFVFGASIVREPLLSLLPSGRFVNLHLGLSPYYRGSGTNFWPFVNEELEYVGATILHIDPGVDTGDIIAHVRPDIRPGDNVHTIGCKVIEAGVSCLIDVMDLLKNGTSLPRVPQWPVETEKYYKTSDFNEEALLQYRKNLENGLVDRYSRKDIKLVSLR